jgi:DDE family transposase
MRSWPTSRRCTWRCGATRGRWRSRSIPGPRSRWAIPSEGGTTRTDGEGTVEKGGDQDPPATAKVVPFGVLVLLTGALTLVFGSGESSDFWVDALQVWWRGVRSQSRGSRPWVISREKGRENSGRRAQFWKRMVPWADWSGLVIRRVDSPPDHSKYHPIERSWSALETKWNGVLLNCGQVIWACALRMTWNGVDPVVERLLGRDAKGVSVPGEEMETYEARLERSITLPE